MGTWYVFAIPKIPRSFSFISHCSSLGLFARAGRIEITKTPECAAILTRPCDEINFQHAPVLAHRRALSRSTSTTSTFGIPFTRLKNAFDLEIPDANKSSILHTATEKRYERLKIVAQKLHYLIKQYRYVFFAPTNRWSSRSRRKKKHTQLLGSSQGSPSPPPGPLCIHSVCH